MDLCERAKRSLKISDRIRANQAEREALVKECELNVRSLDVELLQLQQELNVLFGVMPQRANMLVGVKTACRQRRVPEDCERLIQELFSRHPEGPSGLTNSTIQNLLHLHSRYCAPAISKLVKRGILRKVMVEVNRPYGSGARRYKYPGYALPLTEVKEKAS